VPEVPPKQLATTAWQHFKLLLLLNFHCGGLTKGFSPQRPKLCKASLFDSFGYYVVLFISYGSRHLGAQAGWLASVNRIALT
jgi:hypothetical protein